MTVATVTHLPVAPTNIHVPAPLNDEPDGAVAWPRVLFSGEEGAEKSLTLARMSADPRLGGMFWLEIGTGETTAREYGTFPGVRYRIIRHDGKFSTVLGQLWAHWQIAKQAELNGEPPIALGIDSMTGVWVWICQWLDLMARKREAAKAKKVGRSARPDLWTPEFVPQITPDLWNLGNKRHDMILSVCQQWPGPVGYTAREKLVTPFKDNGQPDERAPKEWTLEAQKALGFNSSVWVRMTREGRPVIVKARTIQPGAIKILQDPKNKGRAWHDDRIDPGELVFDVLGCEAGVSQAPEITALDLDETLPSEVAEYNSYEGRAETVPAPGRRGAQHAEAPGRTAADNLKYALQGLTALLAAPDPDTARQLRDRAAGDECLKVDVLPYLNEHARAILGVAPTAPSCTLREASILILDVLKTWHRPLNGVIKGREAEAAEIAAIAAAAAEDQAAEQALGQTEQPIGTDSAAGQERAA